MSVPLGQSGTGSSSPPAGQRFLLSEGAVISTALTLAAELGVADLSRMLGGQERTEAEYRELLDEAGFRLARAVRTLSPMSVREATPA